VTELDLPGERLREGFAALGERAAPGPDCPPPDRLWAAATGEAPLAERHEVIAHTATCASCASAFRLARGLAQEDVQKGSDAEVAGRIAAFPPRPDRAWRHWGASLAAVAAVVAFVLLVPSPLSNWWSQPKPYRGGETLEIQSRLAEEATLPRDQADLIWTEGPAGSRYEVRVSTRAGEEIAVVPGLETPRYRIPESSLAATPAGTRLYWQVKVLPPDGRSALSKTFSVPIR